ncbi:hypothetical protein RM780_27100 [Streptomyces sp. DSM 44917]|uniref:Sulfotransferase family protein n=1 Tax=Streptomyces boetiae TaxID=3075541 RepID=A0ABU2LH72_9ACTN|nr:hypothetical protein [Streptomyces sp. DSM 44917]MDT0310588.1 hypothetical protein [Streptomyces sp. DSM 44917]
MAPRTRLVHIGPHKTGTTALQGAFHRAREELAAHGVLYAGSGRQAKEPAVAVTEGPGGDLGPWEALCAEAESAGESRVMISSEFFSNADEDAARAVVEGLRGGPAHVVVTLRPLLRILPSHWQQYVKHGLCHSYEDWLTGLLRRPADEPPAAEFWHRHRHDLLLERWAVAAGAENVTVVVVDDARPERLFRSFEKLLGLPDGLLVPEEGGGNRSLTLGQAELLLRLNRRLAESPVPGRPRQALVRDGVVPRLQGYSPAPGEPRIVTPAWAQEAASAVAEKMVAAIAGSGLRVIGDLAALTPPPGGPQACAAPEVIPTAVAVEAVLGGIAAGAAVPRPRPVPPPERAKASRPEGSLKTEDPAVEDRPVRRVPARDLLRVLGRRGVRRLRRGLRGRAGR